MIDAFRRMRLVHELLLLEQAARLPLSTPDRRTCKMPVSKLTPEGGRTRKSLETFEYGSAPETIRHFLRSLGRYVRVSGSERSALYTPPT